MADGEEKKPAENEGGYMEELSKAYAEAFRKRLAGNTRILPEEKRVAIAEMQRELSRTAGKLALLSPTNEKKELARMLKESAEETLSLLETEESFVADPAKAASLSALLTRATMLGNRCLNLLVRHTRSDERLVHLILSELSVLYAFAAIN
ncbi:MAG: hypothetical protein IJT69_00905 [Clostridia bacterium]|nr:hypothetical protein [Clostridia bacterium]